MPDRPRIYEGDLASQRLLDLGLTSEDLTQALLGADEEARRYQSEHDARNAAGLVRWARTVRLLRSRLADKGWGCDDPRNLPVAIHLTKPTAIVATTGDGATGFSYADPRTLYPKGAATKAAVEDYDGQLSIMDVPGEELGEELARAVLDENQQRQVWFLLYHYDRHSQVVRAELSLPEPGKIQVGKPIERWQERILLDTLDVGHGTDGTPS